MGESVDKADQKKILSSREMVAESQESIGELSEVADQALENSSPGGKALAKDGQANPSPISEPLMYHDQAGVHHDVVKDFLDQPEASPDLELLTHGQELLARVRERIKRDKEKRSRKKKERARKKKELAQLEAQSKDIPPRVTVVLSDTDNDLKSVKYSLWIAGICDKKGHWRNQARNVRIIHTGDWLNKWNPEPRVADFFQALQENAPKSCEVIMLYGNHEVELLKKQHEGRKNRLHKNQLAFIRRQDFMFFANGTLYLHGYPTFGLLRLLKQIKDEKKGLNAFNKRFRKAFVEGRYALFKDEAGLELVGDIRKVRQYYIHPCEDGEKKGFKISRLLQELDIKTIIHGHRPNVLAQVDDELKIEVPGIRIINNDNAVKKTGLGAAIVDKNGNFLFVNLRELYWAGGERRFRKKIRKLIGM
ncbi:MAG: metallophosphoesterase [Magnetococcales bacterium]|nr:metallophosphoesterase [Magnetococcales bacterium]